MTISLEYIQGVVDTIIDFYETENGCIDPDKQMEINYTPIYSGTGIEMGMKVSMTYIVESGEDNIREDNSIKVYSYCKLSSFVADISSMLNDIDSVKIN